MGEYSIILYAESAGRHADFISSLYHPHLDEARKEKSRERRGTKRGLQKKTTEESLLEDSNLPLPPSRPPPTWKREIAPRWRKLRQRGKRGVVVSACVFPEKEPVGWSSRERWSRKGKIREEARRRRVDNVGKT